MNVRPRGISETDYNFLEWLDDTLKCEQHSPGVYVPLKEHHVIRVCELAINRIKEEPMLLELQAPIVVVGDIHGQFHDLLRIFGRMGSPRHTKYLFLGDYVDRGPQSLEIMTILLIYKILYPKNVYLLRGNHEAKDICYRDGFKKEIVYRFRRSLAILNFIDIFNHLPIAAIIENKIFCVHGGIARQLFHNENRSIREIISSIPRPIDIVPNTLPFDLLWSDPIHKRDATPIGWIRNSRGREVRSFGHDVINNFLNKFNLQLIFRGHEWHMEGYRRHNQGKLMTIFSAPNYRNVNGNKATVVKLVYNEKGVLEKRLNTFEPSSVHYLVPFMA